MKIEIISWECQGLRCPDMKIDLMSGENPAHVALIQMPNGTAKTTTLNLIRAALTGEATKWNKEDVKSYRRNGDTHSQGSFILNLKVDNELLTFELMFKFEEGMVNYSTSFHLSGGMTYYWNPPINIKRFLESRFVRLFIFDGELAQELLDSNKSEASQAIDSLFQLYLLDELHNNAENHWDRETFYKAKCQRGYTRQKNLVDGLKRRIETIEEITNLKRIKHSKLEKEIEDLNSKIEYYLSQDQNLDEKLKEKEKDLIRAEERVIRDVNELMDKIRKPQLLHPKFINLLIELKDKFDKAELPEKASRQFFIDLCHEKECICGRELNDEIREIIRQRADLYLSDNTAAFLNSLKEDIRRDLLSTDNEIENSLKHSVNNLQDTNEYRELLKNERDYLKQEIIDQGSDEVKKWQEQLDENKNIKNKLELELEAIEREPNHHDNPKFYEKTNCLKALYKWREDEEIKLAEISNTIEMRKKKEVLQKIIELTKQKANNNLRESIRDKCNVRLSNILHRDPISISEINHSITLQGQKAASIGQTLSVGYIFLTTLLSEGQNKFPLLVDSPANSIDVTVRREIAQLIPKLCQQFIAFTISSEREGFTDTLDKHSEKIKFLTVFRKTQGTEKLEKTLPSEGVTHTQNCVIVQGKDYFDNFDTQYDLKEQ
ncbi:AAA family ATPase [Crocosphaera sp. XPORK-15E]|uniref:AAA family ATPase n=1 Tax=Crocosphaera sp. XPORK-15E TaxID=3110247 RepID=UPI002B203506|nr:AAA family ATPase [Crocosphaera sp. XPORK-15E]MEA5533732.1 AAA family ATPase [Crocosphaera sp. XPORK-15E]